MQRLTRQQAKAVGAPRCFGSVCKKHPELEGERRVSGACVRCASEATKLARELNPGRTKEHAKKRNLVVKNNQRLLEKKRQSNAKYRAENKEKVNAAIKLWRAQNKPLLCEYVKRSKAKNPDVSRANVAKRRAARMSRTPAWLTEDDLWMMKQAYELAELRTKIFGFAWHVDHIIPLQGENVSGLHTPNNLQVIPWAENISKGNLYQVN
jgi:5-methylcytosine-specific restriction endonuclease McrA